MSIFNSSRPTITKRKSFSSISILYLPGLIVIILAIILATPTPTKATGVVGNGTSASCTEVALNNALQGGGLITFNCGTATTTINFSTQKIISTNTIIDGGGRIILNRVGTAERFFAVNFITNTFTLKNITFENGYAQTTPGGVIYTRGNLIVENSIFHNNKSSNTVYWGVIYGESGSNLTIINSTFDNNSRGAVFCDCSAIITGSSFTKNVGGAVIVSGEFGNTAYITNSIFAENTAIDYEYIFNGGNVVMDNTSFINNISGEGGTIGAAHLTINDSLVSNNKAKRGGGIRVGASLDMNNTIVTGNEAFTDNGGGIYIDGSFGDYIIKNSTISNNTAIRNGGGIGTGSPRGGSANLRLINSLVVGNKGTTNGGGIYTDIKSLNIINSTIANNSTGFNRNLPPGYGGGVYVIQDRTLNVVNSTIANNKSILGGGIYTPDSFFAQINIKNSILAGNVSSNCNTNILSVNNYNLISDNSCGIAGTDPLIGTLSNNGGATKTFALLPGSPAINGGDPAGCTDFSNNLLNTDQRNFARPSGNRCDIGAYEASFIIVNSGSDGTDAAAGDGACETGTGNGICTLRAAIEESQQSSGTKHIIFNLSQTDPSYNSTTGNFVLTPTTPLPTLKSVVIDGLSIEEASCTSPKLEINGGNLLGTGLNLSGGVNIGGIIVHSFIGTKIFSKPNDAVNNLRCVKVN